LIKVPQNLHLYVYSQNNPIKYIDPSGEISCEAAISEAIFLFRELRRRAKIPGKKINDKYVHCVAFCEIARGCGKKFAKCAGVGWERLEDIFPGHKYDPADIKANEYGINAPPGRGCAEWCYKRYPMVPKKAPK
jgi:hypothetical protein